MADRYDVCLRRTLTAVHGTEGSHPYARADGKSGERCAAGRYAKQPE